MGVRREGITFVDDVGGGGGGVDVNITGPIGQKPMAQSVSVTIANDQSPIPITLGGFLSTSHNFTSNNENFDVDVSQLGSAVVFQATAIGGFDGGVDLSGSTNGVDFFGVIYVRSDDGQPIGRVSQGTTSFAARINVAGLKILRLKNTNWTVGSSLYEVSGSAAPYVNAGVNIFDQATGNHLQISGQGRAYVDIQAIGGTPPDVNAGNATNGTQRVILATNQPAVPISATSLPLPTGAATSANQTTEISSLSSIDSKLTNVATSTLQTTLEQDLIQNLNEHNVLLRAILLQLNYIGLQLNAPVVPAEMVDIAMVH